MQTENFSFTHKKKRYSAVIAWPENLKEALEILGDREVWKAFRLGYVELVKRRMISPTPRPRIRKIDLNSLPEDTAELLDRILSNLSEQKNPPPSLPQTFQSDSFEKQEEASVEASPHGDSFEADFARYSAFLDSLPQQPKETSERLE